MAVIGGTDGSVWTEPSSAQTLKPGRGFCFSLQREQWHCCARDCRPVSSQGPETATGPNALGWELKREASWKREIYQGLYCSQHVWEVSLSLSVMTYSSIQIDNPDSYSCQSVGLYRWLKLSDLSKELLPFFSLGMRVMSRFKHARQALWMKKTAKVDL